MAQYVCYSDETVGKWQALIEWDDYLARVSRISGLDPLEGFHLGKSDGFPLTSQISVGRFDNSVLIHNLLALLAAAAGWFLDFFNPGVGALGLACRSNAHDPAHTLRGARCKEGSADLPQESDPQKQVRDTRGGEGSRREDSLLALEGVSVDVHTTSDLLGGLPPA